MQLFKTSDGAKKQIDIKFVQEGILAISNFRYRSVIETSSINFELKSEAEQDALTENYQNFLNGLGSCLQIIVRTREIDLDNYLHDISYKSKLEESDVWRNQLQSYGAYVRGLVDVNKILSRSFYVVIPYDSDQKHDFENVKEQLNLRTDIISKGLQRLGMHTKQLSSIEILTLFYSFYNPKQAKCQPMTNAILNHMHDLFVEAKK